ncbi:hypothetical protein [Altericista sp. CCNU0014]|uniref:hypothetical protein n=1 Tax=Altericista sp. CCNU0014 TaxID=3082949 RepID=UPI00384CA917
MTLWVAISRRRPVRLLSAIASLSTAQTLSRSIFQASFKEIAWGPKGDRRLLHPIGSSRSPHIGGGRARQPDRPSRTRSRIFDPQKYAPAPDSTQIVTS